ncbi:hypothetical protein PMAYCL1PPCAC_19907 [Pristionchus mayeri]|uniref:BTB domain-containing protein n=1 Tax=Pristionchus mayeri TaxID=1317129 RepID=A0AAN5CSC6_9BILA|nr:hypothetical protein PMAYCL1PPCAC_19907 [Pristionchus mayeri]
MAGRGRSILTEDMKRAPDGVIRFSFDGQLRGGGTDHRNSSIIQVGGVPWRAQARRKENLFIIFECLQNQSTPWTIDVKSEITLVNSDALKNVTKKDSDEIEDSDAWTAFTLMDWNDVVDKEKGFIIDDKITIEFHFWLTRLEGINAHPWIDFTDSSDPCHDVALVIQGEKVHVSKAILASHSPYFRTLFFGDFAEKNKKEIELKDIDREEFIEMLYVIYPSNTKITEESAEYLLGLGDRFQIMYVIERAEKVIIDADRSVISDTEKLLIADKYKLTALKNRCISSLSSVEKLWELKESSIYEELSVEMMRALFEKTLKMID